MTSTSDHLPGVSKVWLIGFLAINISAFSVITCLDLGGASSFLGWVKTHWDGLLILYLEMVLIVIVGNLVNSNFKAVLVFWRWSNPLPVSRVFTKYLPTEPPMDPKLQNNLWHKIFRKHEADPAVEEARNQFLLAQELTWLSFVLLLFFGSVSFTTSQFSPQTLAYPACLLLQYIATSIVARKLGIRFISNVLAVGETHKHLSRIHHQTNFARSH